MLKILDCVEASSQQMLFAVRAMRNAKNSWELSDSAEHDGMFILGNNDASLMNRLASSGSDDRKFMRQIPIMVTINAPLYWWKEFDTYKIGTVRNSCSTMHKIMSKEFTVDDFSFDKIDISNKNNRLLIEMMVNHLNDLRDAYFEETVVEKRKDIWYELIQFLPSSYNQMASITLNYEVLRNMYHARKNHKLEEWHTFCEWVESLDYFNVLILDQNSCRID